MARADLQNKTKITSNRLDLTACRHFRKIYDLEKRIVVVVDVDVVRVVVPLSLIVSFSLNKNDKIEKNEDK